MSVETDHQNPDFQRRKTAYFQNFMLRHLREARIYKENGLLNAEGSKSWRNVARHQLLSAVMTQTVSELLGRSPEEIETLTITSLTHDVDKRRQQESRTRGEIWQDELNKREKLFVATGSNFTGFSAWGMDEYILRYVDSSISEKNAGHWFGARDPNNLPEVIIIPWRDRVQGFRENKIDEGAKGVPLYGMTTWDKLEEIMITIESDLFTRILAENPDLAERYSSPMQLTQLVEDRIHEKIISS